MTACSQSANIIYNMHSDSGSESSDWQFRISRRRNTRDGASVVHIVVVVARVKSDSNAVTAVFRVLRVIILRMMMMMIIIIAISILITSIILSTNMHHHVHAHLHLNILACLRDVASVTSSLWASFSIALCISIVIVAIVDLAVLSLAVQTSFTFA